MVPLSATELEMIEHMLDEGYWREFIRRHPGVCSIHLYDAATTSRMGCGVHRFSTVAAAPPPPRT